MPIAALWGVAPHSGAAMRHTSSTLRTLVVVIVLGVTLATLPDNAVAGDSPMTGATRDDSHETDPTTARDTPHRLQAGWKRSSDSVVTVVGDAVGLHVLRATAASGYSWSTVATLGGPTASRGDWIGNACVTSSGKHAVVVYAPREFANEPALFLRAGSAAVVDLVTGRVRRLDVGGSLAYFNPSCGADDDAVLTQLRLDEEDRGRTATRLFRIDASTGDVADPVEVRGQLSSAVPVKGGIVATRADKLVRISTTGVESTLVRRADDAFRLTVDGDGGVVYIVGSEESNAVQRVEVSTAVGVPETLARSTSGWLGVSKGSNGDVFVLDDDGRSGSSLGHGITVVQAKSGDMVSSNGELVLEQAPDRVADDPHTAAGEIVEFDNDGRAVVEYSARVVETSATIEFAIPTETHPSHHVGKVDRSTAASVTGTGEPEATCAVPRNDAKSLVYQPTPNQVEWAVDLAVAGKLTTARPANWKGSGLPSWSPQGMFPRTALRGGGQVPPQVLLGILAQESNLWQASGHALSGVFGNPLIGDYYGRAGGWDINFADADCGYGVGQVTDGMRKGAMDATKQRAIALDYATNIARALQILSQKWNQLYDAGLLHDDGNPAAIENWIFAVWAYNSGFYPNMGDGSPWGVGWFNNPANPIYPRDRGFFNENPSDPTHPQHWPYPEKVFGWAAYPIYTPDGPGFKQAWWISDAERALARPPIYQFCDSSNNCSQSQGGCPAVNETCWWHKSTRYHECSDGYCGNSVARYGTTATEPAAGTNYPPQCTLQGIPTGSLIVDDVPAAVEKTRCGKSWTQYGKFTVDFDTPSGRIDFHQIGSGFGGHFWFAHTRSYPNDPNQLKATATWTYTRKFANQWGRVFVHLPDHGAHTQQAQYVIDMGNGTTESRFALQRRGGNDWISLGTFKFNGYPKISLSSKAYNGDGTEDIAFDAVAIKPLAAKPKHFVVSMGDSYISGEGATTYDFESNYGGKYGEDDPRRNACHRSHHAWPRKAVLKDKTISIGLREERNDATIDFHHIACSGAESEQLLPYFKHGTGTYPTNAEGEYGTGQYGEVSQIDKGYLNNNTTLVMLSIGGNDAQFGPVIKDCANPLDIGDDCRSANSTGDGPNDEVIPDLIRTNVKASVATVIRQIHRFAPNAKILLMAYPQLISDGANCLAAVGLNEEEAAWINDMSTVMNNTLATVASSFDGSPTKVTLGAPVGDFLGRGVCGDHAAIHGLVRELTDGDPDGAINSAESFHPNYDGTGLYANAANRALRAMGF